MDAHGQTLWSRVAGATPSGTVDYEALATYPDAETRQLIDAACRTLAQPASRLLEDVGLWLVTSGDDAPIRRLLRFGGTDYVDFLHSLDDLPGRARLAVDGLNLPALELREHAPFTYTLRLGPGMPGFGWVMQGVLQAMADDYGALAVIDVDGGGSDGGEVLHIRLFQTDYAQGNSFELAARRS